MLRELALRLGGLEDREVPLFADPDLRAVVPGARRLARRRHSTGTVMLWPDTFTNYFHPHVGQAAVEVLESAGWRVTLPHAAASAAA